jgi:U1 small nuclear ribonucleoprotein
MADKPSADPNISGDAYKTLFISRLDYGIEEKDLRKVFSAYGAIDDVC